MNRAPALLVALLATLAVPAAAEDVPATATPPAVASVLDQRVGVIASLSMRRIARSLTLDQADTNETETDLLWKAGVFAGVRVAWTDLAAPRGHLRSDFELGVEYLPHTGGVPLTLQVTTAWVWRFAHELWVSLGLRLAFSVDLPDADVPHGELSVPLGLGWRWLELQYAPGLVFSLHRDTDIVYGGTLSEGAAAAFMPLNFSLVFRFR